MENHSRQGLQERTTADSNHMIEHIIFHPVELVNWQAAKRPECFFCLEHKAWRRARSSPGFRSAPYSRERFPDELRYLFTSLPAISQSAVSTALIAAIVTARLPHNAASPSTLSAIDAR